MEHGIGQDKSAIASPTTMQPVYFTLTGLAQDKGLDLARLWKVIAAGKWRVFGVMAAFAFVAIIYSLVAIERYRAEVLLAPVGERNSTGSLSGLSNLANLAGVNLQSNSTAAEAIAFLESKKFAEDFIQDKQLIPVFFAYRWDANKKKWKSQDTKKQPDMRDAVEYFSDHVRFISKDAETGFITLAVEWTDPVIATEWAADLVARANEATRQRHIQEIQTKLDYLNEQLAGAKLFELRQAIAGVIEEQIKEMTMAQAQMEYAFRVIDPAMVPKKKAWPQPILIVIASVSLGGLVGIFIVLVEYGRRGLSQVKQQDGRERNAQA